MENLPHTPPASPAPRFDLRLVGASDLEALLSVYRQCEDFLALGTEPHASRAMVLQDIERSRQEGGRFCGIFIPDGGLAGVVDWIPAGFEGQPGQAFLSLLMIARPFRGQGLGQAVVRQVEAEIRRDPQVRAILSAVQVNNPGAARFWQRQGYRIAAGPAQQPDGTITCLLRKDLE